jgi:hypothetical protein
MVRSFAISACIIPLLAAGSASAQNTDGPGSRAGKSPYTVDGLVLGARVDAQSQTYRGYQCSPSEQFPEFTRCQRTQRQQGGWGRRSFDSTSSILHGGDGKAVYINHYLGPWTFDRNEIQTEITRLSGKFGERAREMRSPQREGAPFGIIASWGQVQLEPLDGDAVAIVASGESPHKGFLIDYLGDLRRSAQLGLPIYSIHGGAGYLWSASADRNARGHIRYLTIDASALSPATEKPQSATEAKTEASTEAKAETKTAEAMPAPTPQAAPEIARAEPEQASVDKEVAKPQVAKVQVATAELDNAPVSESAPAPETPTQQGTAPDREKLEALVARMEAQLARAEAAGRTMETWSYRSIAGLVVFLIVAAVLLRAWRRKPRATTAAAAKTATRPASATAVAQAMAQSAGQGRPTLVPQDTPPQAIVTEKQAKAEGAAPQASSLQTSLQSCAGCRGEISRDDKFCRHCGTVAAATSTVATRACSSCRNDIGASDTFCRYCGAGSIAVASPSMAFNGDAAENAVKTALFGDAKPA